LGKVTRVWRGFPFAYITVIVLFVIPLLILDIFAVFCKAAFGIFRVGFLFDIFTHVGFFINDVLLSSSQWQGMLFEPCTTTRTTECGLAAFTGRHGTFATASRCVNGSCGVGFDGTTSVANSDNKKKYDYENKK